MYKFLSVFLNVSWGVAVPQVAEQFCARCAEHFVAVASASDFERECCGGESGSHWQIAERIYGTDRGSPQFHKWPASCASASGFERER